MYEKELATTTIRVNSCKGLNEGCSRLSPVCDGDIQKLKTEDCADDLRLLIYNKNKLGWSKCIFFFFLILKTNTADFKYKIKHKQNGATHQSFTVICAYVLSFLASSLNLTCSNSAYELYGHQESIPFLLLLGLN